MSVINALKTGMHDAGWTEGQKLVFDLRRADGNPARIPALAAELVAGNPNVFIGTGAPEVQAALRVAGTIPIVMVDVQNPVDAGLVASLASPGGTVTGIASTAGPIGAKRLEFLQQVVPGLTRVAVLFQSDNPSALADLRAIQSAATANGIVVIPAGASSADELAAAFSAAAADGAEAVLTAAGGPLVGSPAFASMVTSHPLPAISTDPESARLGVLMGYGPNRVEEYLRAGQYFVDRILRGAKPADLPIEQASRFDLAINVTSASALGITIPAALAQQVTEWVQ